MFAVAIVSMLAARFAMADESEAFGHATESEAALIGILYDLKQTQDHKPTGLDVYQGYCGVVDEFLSQGWDENVLNRFYRVSRPLYTTQIFIPNMNADNAPRAFGAESLVKPSRWIIHYKGQVSPPEPGTYRFVGCADDMIGVAVNGKTELVFTRFDNHLKKNTWHSTEPDGAKAADDNLRAGDWFAVRAGDVVDLDVIISERPGGQFNAFLMIQKQGQTYDTDKGGHPILPIFQVAPYDTPARGNLYNQPLFAKGLPTWKCYQ